jgi:hypothetical protein
MIVGKAVLDSRSAVHHHATYLSQIPVIMLWCKARHSSTKRAPCISVAKPKIHYMVAKISIGETQLLLPQPTGDDAPQRLSGDINAAMVRSSQAGHVQVRHADSVNNTSGDPHVRKMLTGFLLASDVQPVQPAAVSDGANGDADKAADNGRFSLGVAPAKIPLSLRDSVRQLSSPLELTEISTSEGTAPISGDGYVYNAVGQMVAKYGADRVGQVMNGMAQMSPSELHSFGFDLKPALDDNNPTQTVNRKLKILAGLCEPGAIEDAGKLVQQMRTEGYTRTFDANELTPDFVQHMTSSASERKAYIDFQQGDFGKVESYLQAHKGAFGDWHTKSFQEQYQDFEKFSASTAGTS